MRSAAVRKVGVLTVAFPVPGFLSLLYFWYQHQTMEINSQMKGQVRPPLPTRVIRVKVSAALRKPQAAFLTREQAALPRYSCSLSGRLVSL